MIDVSDQSQGDTIFHFPMCPLCDQPILDSEQYEIVSARGCKCMAHRVCVEQEYGCTPAAPDAAAG